MKIEKCPYHDVEPEYWLHIFRDKAEKKWLDRDGVTHTMVLPRLADHYYFCPECKRLTDHPAQLDPALEPSDKVNMSRLAIGYSSSKSAGHALANWNKAVVNMTVKIFKKAVAGK